MERLLAVAILGVLSSVELACGSSTPRTKLEFQSCEQAHDVCEEIPFEECPDGESCDDPK
jgi:hypothetical protein